MSLTFTNQADSAVGRTRPIPAPNPERRPR